MLAFENRHDLFEGGTRPSHIFLTNNRPVELFHVRNECLHLFRFIIAMKGHNIAILAQETDNRIIASRSMISGAEPNGRRKRLRRVDFTSPAENFTQQRQTPSPFLEIFRLVVKAPEQNTVIIPECVHNVRHILFQPWPGRRIVYGLRPGTLNPLRIMHAGYGFRLFAEFRIVETAPIGKKSHNSLDPVAVADPKELIDTLFETVRISFPDHVMQKNANRIESQAFGKVHFLFYGLRVERLPLPHFELIDCRRSNIVEPYRPFVRGIPGIRPLFRPSFGEFCRRSGTGYGSQ